MGAAGIYALDSRSAGDKANQALTALGNLYDVQPQDITGDGLRTITPLEGTGNKPTSAQRKELENATVAVMEGKPGDRLWIGNGTGTEVSYMGRNWVLSALHLFNASYTEPLKARGADDLTGDNMGYAIADPRLTENQRDHDRVVGRVTGAAFLQKANAQGPDLALLKIKPIPPLPHDRSFRTFTAIPMRDHLLPPPKPGEQVALYGVPAPATNLHSVEGEGTYLGRTRMPIAGEPSVESVDVVGLQVTDSSKDACEHGNSGESFIAPNNYVSGPLFYRAALAEERVPFGEQAAQTVETPVRWKLQKALEANLSAYTVLCAFTVMSPNDPLGLFKGFGKQIDPYR